MKRTFSYILLSLFPALVFAQNYRTVFDNVEYRIDPSVMINSVASDIAPFFVNDSIYFSAVAEKYMNRTNREKNNTDFYNVYSASVNSNGIITSRRRSVPGLNNEYHEGPADYCELTGELFITLSSINDIDRVQKMVPVENIRLQLAILKKLNGKWTLIEKLPLDSV